MCGIVASVSVRNITGILLEGLQRLEYRGYDSSGVAGIEKDKIVRVRAKGKVAELGDALNKTPLHINTGISHTRWATHGVPSKTNAHPHVSNDEIAVVHNGIIENFDVLKTKLIEKGYEFESATDTETIAHLVHFYYQKENDLLKAVQAARKELEGAYALAVISAKEPGRMVVARQGSPLVIGLGYDENYAASDHLALLPMTQRFVYLQEGDVADIGHEYYLVYSKDGKKVDRPVKKLEMTYDAGDRGHYRHHMQKEIYDQVQAVSSTLEGRISKETILNGIFGENSSKLFKQVERIQIAACGTSYHAGLVARYWIEELAGIPCSIEVASELRYRKVCVSKNTLFVCISQSGETADTLAALRQTKELGYLASLTICNVPESSMVREADMSFMTRAGVEVGVASTKAFTTQLVSLLLLTASIAKTKSVKDFNEKDLVNQLYSLPSKLEAVLLLDKPIANLAEHFAEKHHTLFLGRGVMYPIALEGSLKLKEISYIHAEAYPAGELKHGPLALVDKDMPVVAVAPDDELLEKLKSNLEEVRSRGGELIIFADKASGITPQPGVVVFEMASVERFIAPIVYTIPLQLLSYHVAVIRGTDVDQPRNLAKSVTVE